MVFLKKMPWGIVAGICAIIVVFATVGVVALALVLGGIAGQTNQTAGMFDEWYQVLLFVVDIICGVLMIGSIVLFVLKKLGIFDKKEKITEGITDADFK